MLTPPGSSFRRVQAAHPDWRGFLRLSNVDNRLIHETHGSLGTYSLAHTRLSVKWDKWHPETFVEVDDIYLHESLVAAGDVSPQAKGASDPSLHVISLKRTPERRSLFAAVNRGLRFTFFDAVDGQTLSPDALRRDGILGDPVPYSNGALGCALSHLALWNMAIQEEKVITVVEDDAVLRSDFAVSSQAVIERLPPDWDLIMWGWNFDSMLSLNVMRGISSCLVLTDQGTLRRSIGQFRADTSPSQPMPLERCFGTCAYSISPKGAAVFKENCFPLKPMSVSFPLLKQPRSNNGIDIEMNALYPNTRSFVSIPPLAVTPNFNAESLTLRP
jgi:GR25 family glycosyltransferase involved in LPS biosynthesis